MNSVVIKTKGRRLFTLKPVIIRVLCISVIFLLLGFSPSESVFATEFTFPEDDAFMSDLAKEIAAAMEAFQPHISTHVLSADETGVFINAGARDRALIGMRFKITNPNNNMTTIIRLDRVEDDFSHGVILSGPMPDIMYGAEYIPEEAWVHYILPSTELEEKADIFLSLAFSVKTAGGWDVASVGNGIWNYSVSGQTPPPLKTFTCELSFTEYLPGVPAAPFTLTAPGGEHLEGGITYYGDWVPIKPSSASGSDNDGWFNYEATLPQDAFAIEATDITGDGAAEIIVACHTSLRIYRRQDGYLELRFLHQFTPLKYEPISFGELGYLGLLKQSNAWRFYIRGPRYEETAVCELKEGVFNDLPGAQAVPLAVAGEGKRVMLAHPPDTYHCFQPAGISVLTAAEGITMSLPGVFTFMAVGDFDGVSGYETAYLDKNSVPHLMVGDANINGEFSWGAGLWGFDVDADGQDELVTTGRRANSDHLEYYKFDGERFLLNDVSPEFEGSILDAAFADFNGDGDPEPAVLVAFGRERRIIF